MLLCTITMRSLMSPLCSHNPSLPFLTPDDHEPVLCLPKWNHTGGILVRLTQRNSLQSHPSCCSHLQLGPFHCWLGFCGMDVPLFIWTIHPWRDIWGVSRFGLSHIKLLWMFVYKFLHGNKSSFLWDQCNCCSLVKSTFCFERNWLYYEDRVKDPLLDWMWMWREREELRWLQMS